MANNPAIPTLGSATVDPSVPHHEVTVSRLLPPLRSLGLRSDGKRNGRITASFPLVEQEIAYFEIWAAGNTSQYFQVYCAGHIIGSSTFSLVNAWKVYSFTYDNTVCPAGSTSGLVQSNANSPSTNIRIGFIGFVPDTDFLHVKNLKVDTCTGAGCGGGGGGVGPGTLNKIGKFTSTSNVGDSACSDNGTVFSCTEPMVSTGASNGVIAMTATGTPPSAAPTSTTGFTVPNAVTTPYWQTSSLCTAIGVFGSVCLSCYRRMVCGIKNDRWIMGHQRGRDRNALHLPDRRNV